MYGKTNRKFNMPIAVLSAFLMLGVVCIHTIPVFADVNPSQFDIEFMVDSAQDYNIESTSTTVYVKVPLFMNIYISSINRYNYISGYLTLASGSLTTVLPCTIDGTAANYLYFEPFNDYGVTISRPDLGNVVVYFDNYLIECNSTSATYQKFIGYLVYSGTCTDGVANVRFNPNSITKSVSSSTTLTISTYETGFVTTITNAINSATDVDTIISILNNIDSSTGYLPDVLTELQTWFPQLYQMVYNIASTNNTIKSYVIYIFDILNDAYSQEQSQAESVADDVNSNLEGLAHDISVVQPSAVADIADGYIAQVDTSYNNSIFGFLSNGTIILMLCIVFAFAVLSYMLYGGQ